LTFNKNNKYLYKNINMQEIQIELNKEEINAIMSLLDIANKSEG